MPSSGCGHSAVCPQAGYRACPRRAWVFSFVGVFWVWPPRSLLAHRLPGLPFLHHCLSLECRRRGAATAQSARRQTAGPAPPLPLSSASEPSSGCGHCAVCPQTDYRACPRRAWVFSFVGVFWVWPPRSLLAHRPPGLPFPCHCLSLECRRRGVATAQPARSQTTGPALVEPGSSAS